eukprot:TRINITY_DN3242_c0_g1_i1.p1 TRINITY_DN3242_c0_g1~~TRINITY_DN3242_c0_g1_i1.p1  ORF type:complete len:346 (-),score=74.52 TRINITY_DN3242_c0_g1_i1:14-1051(-)
MEGGKIEVDLFGWDLSHKSAYFNMAVLSAGTFLFHITSNYFIEKLFLMDGFEFGFFFTTVQFYSYCIISGLSLWFKNQFPIKQTAAPISSYIIVALLLVGSMGLSNASLVFLSYPVQQLFKSCKLVPVIIGGKLIMKRVYGWGEYISTVLLTAGLFFLAFEKISFSSEENMDVSFLGIILISGGLIADGGIGNFQEKVMTEHKVPEDQLVFYSHFFGGFILLIICYLKNELYPAVRFCIENPSALLWMLLIFTTAYIGVRFVLGLIKLFGSFVAMTVTSVRRVATICLSFVLFPKPVTNYFLLSAFLIFSGLFIHIYSKNKTEIDQFLSSFRRKEREESFTVSIQ